LRLTGEDLWNSPFWRPSLIGFWEATGQYIPYRPFPNCGQWIEKRKNGEVNLAPILKKVRKAVNAGLFKNYLKNGEYPQFHLIENSMLFDIIGLGGD